MTRLRKSVVSAAAAIAGFGASIVPALAAISSDTGLSGTATEAGYSPDATSLPVLIGGVIQGLMQVVGMLFLLLIIYAGFIWATAQGSDEKIKKAKAIISSAVIGLVLTFSAYTITGYVVSVMTATLSEPQAASSDPIEDVYGGCPEEDPLCNL